LNIRYNTYAKPNATELVKFLETYCIIHEQELMQVKLETYTGERTRY